MSFETISPTQRVPASPEPSDSQERRYTHVPLMVRGLIALVAFGLGGVLCIAFAVIFWNIPTPGPN